MRGEKKSLPDSFLIWHSNKKKKKKTKNQKTSCKQSSLVLKVAKSDLKKQDPVGAHTIKNSYA